MNTSKNKPAMTLTDGRLKATLWKNQGEKGPFYSIELTRSYQDDEGNWHDSHAFSGTELLRIARLAGKAYDHASELRRQAAAQEDHPEAA